MAVTFCSLWLEEHVPPVWAKEAATSAKRRHSLKTNRALDKVSIPPGWESPMGTLSLRVHDWLDMTFEEWDPASVRATDAIAKYPASQEPQTGFGLVFGGQTIFPYLGERPERAKVFVSAMGNFSRGVSHLAKHALRSGTVVDIGASHDHISIAIADAAPNLSFVVQDLPYTATNGEQLLPSKYKSRTKFEGHDMHDIQPVH
ncbi:MAG: hypothetical protein Q9216_003210, partial [Gyalolechia sp. 2 TL-2023]